ncbi:septal ring lytic transglycosylase RlpA family protein [Nevskia soli]|uniref:septal ring lytic transglycosylase RlpA family protein n=1 Tax=Nevskia soli TaxID=418856 RepID=UPI000B16C9E0|nr:septal ring lytic transglycosylase RlpA family protein [Nevskia soli]
MIGSDVAAMRSLAAIALCCLAALLTGCGGGEAVRPSRGSGPASGGHSRIVPIYPNQSNNPSQDGPPSAAEIPANVADIPDAVPQPEPKSSSGNPDSYEVYGDHYVILKDARGYKERGYASWYGKKFQGKRTSSGEAYDMFKMTAAHKTLPIPCYARVTNIDNGKSVVVRINDRGPFHEGRIIDLSYTAAVKLGSLGKGSIPVEVEAIDPSMPTPTIQYAGTPRPPAPAPQQQAPAMAMAPPPRPPPQPAAVATAAPPPPTIPATVATAAIAVAAAPAPPRLSLANTLSSAPSAPPVVSVPAQTVTPTARYLQAGLFNDPINAVTMRDQLNGLGIANVQLKNDTRNGNAVSRVLIGPFIDDELLAVVRKRLSELRLPAVPVIE